MNAVQLQVESWFVWLSLVMIARSHGRESSTVNVPARYRKRVGDAIILALAGPTGSGKSAAALELCALWPQLGIEIISTDALQGYRGFDIGTAKPSAAERAQVTHHLVDHLNPSEALDVIAWCRAAEGCIDDVLARGRTPLLVGGTGFYLSALADGLPSTPRSDPQLRGMLEAELAERGLTALYAELAAAAPSDAAATQRNPRRVVRALEVLRASGQPPSTFVPRAPRFTVRSLIALPEWRHLELRLEQRLDSMLAAGWLDEVAGLLSQVPPEAPAWQAIGYRELAAVLKGERTLTEARAEVLLATRRYAKRQRTFFLRRPKHAERIMGDFSGESARLRDWWNKQASS
jgi:tRNA dimethylallyltransferase